MTALKRPPRRTNQYTFTRIEVESFPATQWHRGAMLIEWEAGKHGIGQLFVYTATDGTLKTCDKSVPRDFVVALLAELGQRVQLGD